jgi:hypothetical protein
VSAASRGSALSSIDQPHVAVSIGSSANRRSINFSIVSNIVPRAEHTQERCHVLDIRTATLISALRQSGERFSLSSFDPLPFLRGAGIATTLPVAAQAPMGRRFPGSVGTLGLPHAIPSLSGVAAPVQGLVHMYMRFRGATLVSCRY